MYPRGKRSLLVNGLKMHSLAQTIHVAKNIRSSYWEILRNLLGYEATHDASGEVIIWGHSWEIEELDLWSDVEDIFKIVSASYKQQCVSYEIMFAGAYNENFTYQDNLLPRCQKKLGHDVIFVANCWTFQDGKEIPTKPCDYVMADGVRLVRLPYKHVLNGFFDGKTSRCDGACGAFGERIA